MSAVSQPPGLLGRISRASRRDADAIAALRVACYRQAREFELLQPQCLSWTALDDEAVVFQLHGLDSELLATVRSHWVASAAALEQRMGCECELPPECFPTLYFSRGATVPSAGRLGLHSVLRYHYLLAAQRLGAASATGSVYEHAPRVRSMAELGYRFDRPQRIWDPEVRLIQAMLVAWLPAAGLAEAVRTLAAVLGDTLHRCPIDFDVAAAQGPCPRLAPAGAA